MTDTPEISPLLGHSKQVSESTPVLLSQDSIPNTYPLNEEVDPWTAREFPDDWTYSRHRYLNIVCEHCGKSFNVPVYCGNRFCNVCAFSRQSRIRARIKFLIDKVPYFNTHGIKQITLTIKNMKDLPEMIRILIKSFRKLRSKRYWKQHVKGGAFVIEVTGCAGNWHAHIHAVVQCNFIPHKDLQKLWLKITGSWNVDIREIPINKAVHHLTKYLTKTKVVSDDIITVAGALKGLRMFSPFGTWYAISNTYVKPAAACRQCDANQLTLGYGLHSTQNFRGSEIKLRLGSIDAAPQMRNGEYT